MTAAALDRVEVNGLNIAYRDLGSGLPVLLLHGWPTSSFLWRDVMKPIAAPIIGGMITSTVHVLIITPVIFYIMKLRALRKGTLKVSGLAT